MKIKVILISDTDREIHSATIHGRPESDSDHYSPELVESEFFDMVDMIPKNLDRYYNHI